MKKVKTGAELGAVLKDLGKLAGDDFAIILQKLTLDAFRVLVRRSAQDTGFLRSNWAVTVDRRPPEESLKQSGAGAKQPKTPTVKVEAGSIVVLYNNTEYAIYLETGTPKMRAQPMVEPTRIELEALASQLSKELTRKKYNV